MMMRRDTDEHGTAVNMNGNGARTHWRNIHGLMAHMNLGLSLDFAGKWMTDGEKDLMRRVIAKVSDSASRLILSDK